MGTLLAEVPDDPLGLADLFGLFNSHHLVPRSHFGASGGINDMVLVFATAVAAIARDLAALAGAGNAEVLALTAIADLGNLLLLVDELTDLAARALATTLGTAT